MRRFRVIRGGLASNRTTTGRNAVESALTRSLRSAYPQPNETYWDGLEAKIMAAVRAGRAAPAAAVEWWQTLARWARPGLAAATVLLGVVGGALLQTRAHDADSAYQAVLDVPAPLPIDAPLARATDNWSEDSLPDVERNEARAAAELLSDGVKRRSTLPLHLEPAPAAFRSVAP